MYCFTPPSSGEVKVFDIDVTKEPSRIKARIGVMPQEDNLDPDLTVFETSLSMRDILVQERKIPGPMLRELLRDLLE